MKRIIVLIVLLAIAFVPAGWSARDESVMDDIGFDKSFGYYSSGNETINMQTGNVTLTVPVSPMFPGPEGAGLDLQLHMVYNSHYWRYEKDRDIFDHECAPTPQIQLSTVDPMSMYFSPVGTGWTLHMGRLFRIRKWLSNDCASTQYYYEDPSGAMHDFGPYCPVEDPDGLFEAQDGSGYKLLVRDFFSESDRQVVMFDGSGRKFYFQGPLLDAPVLPYEPNGSFRLPTSENEVLYVTKIEAYNDPDSANDSDSITITYRDPTATNAEGQTNPLGYDSEFHFYYWHLIDEIEGPFGRKIQFVYEDLEVGEDPVEYVIPHLRHINMQGFDGQSVSYDLQYESLRLIREP